MVRSLRLTVPLSILCHLSKLPVVISNNKELIHCQCAMHLKKSSSKTNMPLTLCCKDHHGTTIIENIIYTTPHHIILWCQDRKMPQTAVQGKILTRQTVEGKRGRLDICLWVLVNPDLQSSSVHCTIG